MNKLHRRSYPYSLLWPGFIVFAVFFVFPSLGSFYYALTNWNGLNVTRFVGMENFKYVLFDADNALVFKNTFVFTIVTVFFKITLGLLLAVLVNLKLRSSMYLRSMLFFPVILSNIAVALAFTAILHPSVGLLNQSLRMMHLDGWIQSWLVDRAIVMYSISGVEIWKSVGFHMVLFLSGLQTIPKEIYESAAIDGAKFWKQFRHITLPLLTPIINANILLALIGGLKVFDIVYGLTGGGPGNMSNVLNTMIYKNFAAGRYGEATAANVVLFVIVAGIVLILHKILRKREVEV